MKRGATLRFTLGMTRLMRASRSACVSMNVEERKRRISVQFVALVSCGGAFICGVVTLAAVVWSHSSSSIRDCLENVINKDLEVEEKIPWMGDKNSDMINIVSTHIQQNHQLCKKGLSRRIATTFEQ